MKTKVTALFDDEAEADLTIAFHTWQGSTEWEISEQDAITLRDQLTTELDEIEKLRNANNEINVRAALHPLENEECFGS